MKFDLLALLSYIPLVPAFAGIGFDSSVCRCAASSMVGSAGIPSGMPVTCTGLSTLCLLITPFDSEVMGLTTSRNSIMDEQVRISRDTECRIATVQNTLQVMSDLAMPATTATPHAEINRDALSWLLNDLAKQLSLSPAAKEQS